MLKKLFSMSKKRPLRKCFNLDCSRENRQSVWLDSRKKGDERSECRRREEGLRKREEEGVAVWGMWGKERGRGIPPTKIVVERFWGLGRSQETVVAPSQASHRAALGHPVTDRQTYQMVWPGQTDRDLFIFHPLAAGGKIVQHKLFIRPLICHVSAFTRGECVCTSPTCV